MFSGLCGLELLFLFFYLLMLFLASVIDIFSRYVVGWHVVYREKSYIAKELIHQSLLKHMTYMPAFPKRFESLESTRFV